MNPNGIRVAFFDVDGTIVGFKSHEVSRATCDALRGLRRNGVACVLATGRPPYQLDGVPTELFDAFVLFNGQLCRLGDGTVVHERLIDRSDVEVVVDHCQRGLYSAMFQTREGFIVSERDERVRALEEAVGVRYPEGDPALALERDVFQINTFTPRECDGLITSAAPGLRCMRWSPLFADVVPVGCGKDIGVTLMLEHLGATSEQAVCFGDGENDIAMLDACGCAVVMGSASDAVKAHAMLVTEDVDHEGVALACERLGLV